MHHCSEEETKGITDEDMDLCVDMITKISRNMEFFHSKACRKLRKALHPLVDDLRKRSFKGTTRSDYEEKKMIAQERKGREARQKALDQNYLNSVRLRKERLDKLEQLKDSQVGAKDVPLIPDGVALGGESAGTLLCDGARAEAESVGTTVDVKILHKPRACYVCKRRYTTLHHFYDMLCPECAELNFRKRNQSADLKGYRALVTGGRVKIGYRIVLKLLRAGAHVVVTTRFPKDCALRYSKEGDFSAWSSRLDIFGLDLRDIPSLEFFCGYMNETLKGSGGLDIIINNACQTIRRPVKYYTPLLRTELKPVHALSDRHSAELESVLAKQQALQTDRLEHLRGAAEENKSLEDGPRGPNGSSVVPSAAYSRAAHLEEMISSARQSQIPLVPEDITSTAAEFPTEIVDVNGQQVDLRKKNTWVTLLQEVETPELAEVFAINAMAPFVLNSRLVSSLKASANESKFVINVSAMEGKFNRVKSGYHPHTNMAKAALNMMTLTSAKELSKSNIFMTSVDTGWINDENPLWKANLYAKAHNFQTPLDEVDAAARVLDPVFDGVNKGGADLPFGVFFKDYHVTEW